MTKKDALTLTKPSGALVPQTLAEALDLAERLASSSLVPKSFAGKPNDVLVAVQMGAEVGLAPMQALQNIAVINGRPSMYGDAVLAVCQAHPDYEYCNETIERGDGDDANLARCTIKRKGAEPHSVTFSVADAKRAGLWGKSGPWSQYAKRMLQMRARSWACRDVFADALRGMSVAEEQRDVVQDNSDAKPTQDDYAARFAGEPEQTTSEPIEAVYEDQGELFAEEPTRKAPYND
jgi:hypothetical protein